MKDSYVYENQECNENTKKHKRRKLYLLLRLTFTCSIISFPVTVLPHLSQNKFLC